MPRSLSLPLELITQARWLAVHGRIIQRRDPARTGFGPGWGGLSAGR